MSHSKQPIVVFGVTGEQGGSVAAALVKADWPVIALVRDPGSARADALRQAGVELVQGRDTFFDVVVLRLIDLLQRALPDCPREDLFWGYHFVTGGLMLTLGRTGRIDKLSGGLCRSEEFDAVKERMARFMAAGFLATCQARKAERAEPSCGS
jgi:NAD(P)-dependent dehydrogenase (short-subunit alcohol dehydrogenase family)